MTDRKTPSASQVVMTETVLPGDGNPVGTAFGGKIAQWIDVAAGIACQRHCRKRVVTASMDDLHFLRPIRVGMIVELRAQVNGAFRTSMEAGVRIESEDPLTGERQHVCTAWLTFVAQDEHGKPVEVPPLELETDEDRRRAHDARERRALRLSRARTRKERLLAEDQGRNG
jgi:acyl-CoA hydrolase